MQAKSSDKKLVTSNASTLKTLRLAFLATNALYILLRIIFLYSSFTKSDLIWWAIAQTLSVVVYRQLEGFARPSYGADGEILSGGEDLSAGGMIGYMLEVIYIGGRTQWLGSDCLADLGRWTESGHRNVRDGWIDSHGSSVVDVSVESDLRGV